jgi:hypothetical protein
MCDEVGSGVRRTKDVGPQRTNSSRPLSAIGRLQETDRAKLAEGARRFAAQRRFVNEHQCSERASDRSSEIIRLSRRRLSLQ